MRLKSNSLLLFSALLAGSILHAQSTPENALLILSKQDRSLAIVDPASLKIIAHIPVGDDPHEVIASADGKRAYVSNYGGGTLHTLAVIDLVAQKALAPIELSPLRGPHGLTFVGGKTWFTAEGSKAIGSYDPETGKIDWVMGTGQNRTHMIYVSDDLQHIITTNVASGTVSFIDKSTRAQGAPHPPPPGGMPPPSGSAGGGMGPGGPPGPRSDWNQTVVKVGNGSEGFDVSPDGREMWVANAQDGTVSILSVGAKQIDQTLSINVKGANRLKFTLDGKLALISTLGGSDLTIVDVATRSLAKRLKIGRGAAGIQMKPDGTVAYVACTPDNYVVIVDLKTLEVTGKIESIGQPDGMAWATRK
jgi:YVTN family beta-propeller protein